MQGRSIWYGDGWSEVFDQVEDWSGSCGFVWGGVVEVVPGGGGGCLDGGEPAGAGLRVRLLTGDVQGVFQDVEALA